MKEKASVTTLVFTLDEEIHLPSCLNSLAWCDQIVVVDSFSNDATESIAKKTTQNLYSTLSKALVVNGTGP